MIGLGWLGTKLGTLACALGVTVLVFGFGYVRGHRAGAAAGDARVAALESRYAKASEESARAAHAAQARADAQSAARVKALADAGAHAVAKAQAAAASATNELARLRAQYQEETRNDPTVASWGRQPLPAGVRRVLDGAKHHGATGAGHRDAH